jgi:hypothetical protein
MHLKIDLKLQNFNYYALFTMIQLLRNKKAESQILLICAVDNYLNVQKWNCMLINFGTPSLNYKRIINSN